MPQHKNGRTSSTGLKPVAPVRQNLVEPKGHTQRHSLMSCANFLGACALGA